MLIQAGQSGRGQRFAARWAECVFVAYHSLTQAQRDYRSFKTQVEAVGRDPDKTFVCAGVYPVVAETRAEAEGQAFRFPRPWRRLEWRRRAVLAGQVMIGQTFTDDLRNDCAEAVAVIHVFAIVIPKGLFVQVAKEMERLDADIGSFQAALQEGPEIFDSVSVDVPVYLALGMVDHLMNVVLFEAVVSDPRIAEYIRSASHVLAHKRLQGSCLSVL